MDSNLRERLAGLSRARRISPAVIPAGADPPEQLPTDAMPGALSDAPMELPPAVTRDARAGRRRKIPPLEQVLPGEEIQTRSGKCWRHTRDMLQWPCTDPLLPGRVKALLGQTPPSDLGADSGLSLWRLLGFESGIFLDLETTGLSATPVFLAGLLSGSDAGMKFTLLFARNYAEEMSLLEAVSLEMEARPVAITYNGKSYDVPFLKERNGRLRTGVEGPRAVLDLLHPARRRWRNRFTDCRLKTLESALCGRRRGPDVDGRDIPDMYHRYVQNQDARRLLPIFSHNIIDLYTLLDITERVLSSDPEVVDAPPPSTSATSCTTARRTCPDLSHVDYKFTGRTRTAVLPGADDLPWPQLETPAAIGPDD